MSASLAARSKAKVAQYQLSSTNNSATITPYDSGTILGTTPPGKAGIKLVSGVIQNASDLTCDGSNPNDANGNALLASSGVGVVPTVNSAQLASAGLSLAPEHE